MKIEKTECSYQVTECDLKFGEQITLDGELLIPVSVIDKIRAEIEQTAKEYDKFADYRRVRGLWIALEIIDKYKAESEENNVDIRTEC